MSFTERARLALRLKEAIAAEAKAKQREAGGAVRQKSDKAEIDTKKELAKLAGVSHGYGYPAVNNLQYLFFIFRYVN